MERDFLRKLRKERKFSAEQIGDKIGMSSQGIRRLENGSKSADFWIVKDYLSAIGYTLLVIDSAYLVSAQKGIE